MSKNNKNPYILPRTNWAIIVVALLLSVWVASQTISCGETPLPQISPLKLGFAVEGPTLRRGLVVIRF